MIAVRARPIPTAAVKIEKQLEGWLGRSIEELAARGRGEEARHASSVYAKPGKCLASAMEGP